MGLISLAVIGLELASMRALSLRFWHHFAYMVISVALLGFGASGTAITLMRRRILAHHRGWLCGLSLGFALSVPAAYWATQRVPLNVQFLAWNLSGEVLNVAAIELLMFVPFFLAGGVVGAALMDAPGRTGGHYAANLVGSGVGAVAAVALMHVLSTHQLLMAMAAAGYLAGVVLLPWGRWHAAVIAVAAGAGVVFLGLMGPSEPTLSQYKMLSLVRNMPGTRVIHQTEGPLGRIDVVEGPAIHHAPALSLRYTEPPPPHVLLILDGDQTSAVYNCERVEDWAFLDHTTSAAPYHLRERPKVLVIGAGGGSEIGLALFHRSAEVTALEMNPQIIETMRGPLAARGGDVYDAPGVNVVNAEARGYLATTKNTFDIVQFPVIEAFGASGAGVYAAQESYLYTVESLGAMFDHLTERGLLSVTRWARLPLRDGPRIFNIAATLLRSRGMDPARHLAMIRGLVTVTVLVSKQPFTVEDGERIHDFCEARGFDICYLHGLDASKANQFHVLERPYYFEAAQAILGADREAYLDDYLFELEAPTDDKPYFHHFFRWRSLSALREQVGGRAPAFLELGYLLLVAALVQGALAAVLLILIPLAPRIGGIRFVKGKAAALGYFLLLGMGFMLLEMGFMQRLILYLAHPIYSAAVVIGSFLVFGGVGSWLSGCWRVRPKRLGILAGAGIAGLSVIYALGLSGWLALTQGQPVTVRCIVAALTIAPLAVAMGHMFPLGLRQVGIAAPALVPWAWAVNGCASVVATVGASVLAMGMGFLRLTLIATACYALAGILCLLLPEAETRRL